MSSYCEPTICYVYSVCCMVDIIAHFDHCVMPKEVHDLLGHARLNFSLPENVFVRKLSPNIQNLGLEMKYPILEEFRATIIDILSNHNLLCRKFAVVCLKIDTSICPRQFLRATAGTAIARLSHRNSVRPSVRLSVCLSVTRVDQAKTVQAIGSSNLHHRLPQRL